MQAGNKYIVSSDLLISWRGVDNCYVVCHTELANREVGVKCEGRESGCGSWGSYCRH